MTVLTAAMNKENQHTNNNTNNNSKKAQSRVQQIQAKPRNMGGYCHSHGYHPVGLGHNSKSCKWKKEDRKSEATGSNWMGGDTTWPQAKKVTNEQQEHATYKGQLKPTN